LLREGLQVGEVSTVSLGNDVPETVLLQNPKQGRNAATPRVDVLVAGIPREESYVMPYLIGLNEIEAQRRLDLAKLRRKLNYLSAPQWPHATVIDQAPLAGTRIGVSTGVELTVAN
jgi:beta-lactam-binding protein with PASTA domain